MSRRTVVDGPAGPLEVHVHGKGPAVVLLASLGRGAGDFVDLAARLAAAGFRALALEPRGIGASSSPLEGVTMAGLADDVAAVILALAGGRATVVGHAFGNRVARMAATTHPDLVESVVLLACGGLIPPTPEVSAALRSVFDPSLDPAAHLDAVALAFFAPGNDPSPWEGGMARRDGGRARRSVGGHSGRRLVDGGLCRRSGGPTGRRRSGRSGERHEDRGDAGRTRQDGDDFRGRTCAATRATGLGRRRSYSAGSTVGISKCPDPAHHHVGEPPLSRGGSRIMRGRGSPSLARGHR